MKNSLANNAAANVIYRVLNVAFPLISVSYVSRILDPQGIGAAAYVQNIASYFLMIAAAGIPEYGIREVARCGNNLQARNRLFSELFFINLLIALCCTAGYGIFIAVTQPADFWLYLIFGLEVAVQCINIDWLYQGSESYRYIALRSILVKGLSLCGLLLFVRERDDVLIYGAVVCLGSCGNHVFNILNARKRVRLVLRDLRFGRHLTPLIFLTLSGIASSLYSKVDVTMLGWLKGHAQVAYYTNAYKIIVLVLTLSASVTGVFLPRLSHSFQSDRKAYDGYVNLGLKVLFCIVMPCCVGLMVVAENVVAVLFGEAFAPSGMTIRILAGIIAVRGIGDLLCYQALISAGQERKLVFSRILAGVVSVCLNLILIPRWGHNGTAVALVISELIVNGILLRYSAGLFHIRLPASFLASLCVSTGLMAVSAMLVQRAVPAPFPALAAAVLAGAGVYCLSLVLMKNEIALMAIEKIRSRIR